MLKLESTPSGLRNVAGPSPASARYFTSVPSPTYIVEFAHLFWMSEFSAQACAPWEQTENGKVLSIY